MRIFLALLFLLISGQCFGADYWVYIRLTDRIGDTTENNAGRSKAGDIVQVLAVTPTNTPTEQEKSEWFIVKVLNVSDALYQMAMEEWNEEQPDGKIKAIAHRRYKLKLSALKIKKTGLYPTSFNASKISNNLAQKTSSDLTKYEAKRMHLAMQKPCVLIAKSLFSVLVQTAYAATEVVSKINCSTEDYNTLTLWEDAKDGDLVSADQIQVAECYNDDGVLDDKLTIDGSTCDSTHYLKVTSPVGERHTGKAGTGFCIDPSGYVANGSAVIDVNDAYCVVEYMELKGYRTQYNGASSGVRSGDSSLFTIIRNNIVHSDEDYSKTRGISITRNNYVIGNIVYNVREIGIEQVDSYGNNSIINGNTVYNFNTSSGAYYGIYNIGSGGSTRNNIVIKGTGGGGCYSAYDTDLTNDYNVSNDTTATGAHDIQTGSSSYFVSVTAGSEDFHLVAGAGAIDSGVDLGATYGANIDIDGVARSGTWDIGADEYVSAATAALVPMLPQGLIWEN